MITKGMIGARLQDLKGTQSVTGLSKLSVKSIEKGCANYSVSNLITYCQSLSIRFIITDKTTDESYPADSKEEIHSVLQMLMKRWHITPLAIRKKADVYYTPPKNGKFPLSIDTLLTVLDVLHCKVEFIKR